MVCVEKYQAKFADGPDRRAFDVVMAPIGTNGIEFQDIAKKVASVDTLDAFLRVSAHALSRCGRSFTRRRRGREGASTTAPPDNAKAPVANAATPDRAGKVGPATSVQDHRRRRQSRLRRRPTRNRLARLRLCRKHVPARGDGLGSDTDISFMPSTRPTEDGSNATDAHRCRNC